MKESPFPPSTITTPATIQLTIQTPEGEGVAVFLSNTILKVSFLGSRWTKYP